MVSFREKNPVRQNPLCMTFCAATFVFFCTRPSVCQLTFFAFHARSHFFSTGTTRRFRLPVEKIRKRSATCFPLLSRRILLCYHDKGREKKKVNVSSAIIRNKRSILFLFFQENDNMYAENCLSLSEHLVFLIEKLFTH